MDDIGKHSLRWQIVCSVLDRLPKEKRTNRSDIMKDLLWEHRKLDPKSDTAPKGDHMYSLIRLLLPQLDRDQEGNNVLYHMKEIKIAKTFIAALGIKGTPGAQKLLNWRKPEGGEGYGEFGTVLYHQLVPPGRVSRLGKKITVSDVNAFLHDMSAKEEDTDQEALVKDLCTKASALELKWIAKVLLKDLKASATETLVLGALHPDARQLFETNARLRDIVAKCSDPRTRVGSEGIQLMNPFRPMLAEKTEDLNSITKYFKNKPFWLEPKLDGERLLLHKDGEVMRKSARESKYLCANAA
jgi:DNA ligase-4